jgi:hypothetical protein
MSCTRAKSLALAVIAAVLTAIPAMALAQAPSPGTRLTYARGPGAEGCPDDQDLRDVVATLLGGSDPFDANGAKRLDVIIARGDRDFAGQIALYAEDGRLIGSQEHTNATCAALVQEIGASIVIALRPFILRSDAAPIPASEPSPPPRSPPPPSRPPASPPPANAMRLQVGAGAALGGGFAPDLSVGFGGLIGVRWAVASLSFEGRGDLPASMDPVGSARFQTSWLGGSVVPCWHARWFLACGLASAGRVRSTATGTATPEHGAAAYLGFGGRLGLEAPFSSRFAAQLTADVLVNALRPTLRFQDDEVWSVAVVSELASLRLVALF